MNTQKISNLIKYALMALITVNAIFKSQFHYPEIVYLLPFFLLTLVIMFDHYFILAGNNLSKFVNKSLTTLYIFSFVLYLLLSSLAEGQELAVQLTKAIFLSLSFCTALTFSYFSLKMLFSPKAKV
jgi:hypothetical protein